MYSRKNITVAAIIAEYNPFHNGHKYHIEKTRQITGCDYVIVLMSGNFVQRGEPALFDKSIRTAMALNCGADVVIELPCVYATSSAEGFAKGSVDLLNELGCIDYLSFGSECSNLNAMMNMAEILNNPSKEFDELIAQKIKEGLSYPKSRQYALENANKESGVLNGPNNILGIEYIKALLKTQSSIAPVTIKRKGNDYNDNCINPATPFNSASSIREALRKGRSSYLDSIPDRITDLYNSPKSYIDDYSELIYYRLSMLSKELMLQHLDVNDSLASKFIKYLKDFKSLEELIQMCKSKDLTYSRILRCLIHILLGITKEDALNAPSYARILGFKKDAQEILGVLKNTSNIPIITKLADAQSCRLLDLDIMSSNLYNTVNKTFENEYRKSPVII